MTDLRIDSFTMPAADLGRENPLPTLSDRAAYQRIRVHESVPAEAQKSLGYGCEPEILPYTIQDGYNRVHRERNFKVAVLENEILRAIFLLEFGGRLWSLFHKPSGRELLYTNPVFQPANLATRNAWFSGGVEWNCGIPGHTPLTCSPMFAARVTAADGSPILRLYEFERIRGVPYQIDFSLPPGSPWLLATVRIVNPYDGEIPMYWWTNIAVPERPDVRTIAPADWAYNTGGWALMKRVSIPRDSAGLDVTYSTHLRDSTDYFYEIPATRRPWITVLDADGKGLVQASTRELGSRKMFAWGTNPGGRRWQEFLSGPDQPYLEIQAGVARTQFECFPMAARSELSWTEAYGLLEIEPTRAHSANWHEAISAVDERLDATLPSLTVSNSLNYAPKEILHHGSGWGALEQMRRNKAGEPPMAPAGLIFDQSSLGAQQKPWMELLNHGTLPHADPSNPPASWMVQAGWFDVLSQSINKSIGDHWLAHLHLGVMHYHHGRKSEARQAWHRSVEQSRSAWAMRNLAVLALDERRFDEACDLYLSARALQSDSAPLAIEALRTLIDAGKSAEAMQLIDQLPPPMRKLGRIEFLRGRAALELGQLDIVESILRGDIQIADLREGEQSLTDLWYRLHELKVARETGTEISDGLKRKVRNEFPPPARIDFRMMRE